MKYFSTNDRILKKLLFHLQERKADVRKLADKIFYFYPGRSNCSSSFLYKEKNIAFLDSTSSKLRRTLFHVLTKMEKLDMLLLFS